MSGYDWDKIVSKLSDKQLVRLVKKRGVELTDKVDAAEKELRNRGFDPENKEDLNQIIHPKDIPINEDLPFLHSEKSILGATFLGGPLAAAYLIFENYRNLDNRKKANNSLLFGAIATILLFLGVFSIPENIIDAIPMQIIPLIYTGIVYLILRKIFKELLINHKENGGRFYKFGRAAIIAVISSLVIVGGIVAYALTSPTDEENFDILIEEFVDNEDKALEVYSIMYDGDTTEILKKIEEGKEYWEENLLIVKQLKKYQEKKYNELLKEYCNLRLQSFDLLEKAYLENTYQYALELDNLNDEIDAVLEDLSK